MDEFRSYIIDAALSVVSVARRDGLTARVIAQAELIADHVTKHFSAKEREAILTYLRGEISEQELDPRLMRQAAVLLDWFRNIDREAQTQSGPRTLEGPQQREPPTPASPQQFKDDLRRVVAGIWFLFIRWLVRFAVVLAFLWIIPIVGFALWFAGAFTYSVIDGGLALYRFTQVVQEAQSNTPAMGLVLLALAAVFSFYTLFRNP